MYLFVAFVFAVCANSFILEASPASSYYEDPPTSPLDQINEPSFEESQVSELLPPLKSLDRMVYTSNITDQAFANRDRIVGGRETGIHDHPYQVSMVVNASTPYFCGGFIISDRYILTAAHCAQNIDPEQVTLKAGSASRKDGTIIPIESVTAHPGYNSPQFDKDVAVMKTVSPIEFSDAIQPIALPWKDRPVVANSAITVSGWGRTMQGVGGATEQLRAVDLKVVDWNMCSMSYFPVLTRNMFCAGNFFLGGESTCQGDSGGAAIQNNKAVGIVSYGRGCGQPLSPSVFAHLSAATSRDFIYEKTGI